jgi:hypothetical protein
MADAGLEAAKRQLSVVDALPSSYDTADTVDNSPWYDADETDDTGGQTLTFDGNEIRVSIRYLNPSNDEDEARLPDNAPEVLPTYFMGNSSDPEVDLCEDVNPPDGMDDDIDLDVEPPELPNVDACAYENNRNYFRVTVRGGSGGMRCASYRLSYRLRTSAGFRSPTLLAGT